MARISEIVKTYKLLNDPDAPHWSVRFVGGLAIAALVIAGGAAIVWGATRDHGPSPNEMVVASTQNADGTKTDKLMLANFDASLAPDYEALDAQLAAWHVQHPDAQVISQAPIADATHTHTIGYEIRYR
jgi:hypothetical protein